MGLEIIVRGRYLRIRNTDEDENERHHDGIAINGLLEEH